jgi:UvrD/REP helicase N-terminal domain
MSTDAPTVDEEPFRETGRPVLVLAGPGTGKTYQLARRIQFLIDSENVDPNMITVITFTRKAARGMRDRLNARDKHEFVNPSKQPKNILTMHSLGHRIVEENAELLGLQSGVRVVGDLLLKRCLMRDAAIRVGLRESDGLAALDDKEKANPTPSEESARVQAAYRDILKACNAIDYDGSDYACL